MSNLTQHTINAELKKAMYFTLSINNYVQQLQRI